MIGPVQDELIGPGQLVLVVGPSGAGKDALIRSARDRFGANPNFLFPRRTITRPPSATEDNQGCDVDTFSRIAVAGGFAASWTAHGQSYGIPASIEVAITDGHTVVCNVSRTIVDDLRRRYADVLVIEVTAPTSVLAERLASRSRPDDGDLHRRIGRSGQVPDARPDLTIENAGPLEEALVAFCGALADRADAAWSRARSVQSQSP